ncbi:hypothetical protein SRHO_G00157910 [Serrasalmus rhombeus]
MLVEGWLNYFTVLQIPALLVRSVLSKGFLLLFITREACFIWLRGQQTWKGDNFVELSCLRRSRVKDGTQSPRMPWEITCLSQKFLTLAQQTPTPRILHRIT